MSEFFDAIRESKQKAISKNITLQKSHLESVFNTYSNERGFTIPKKGKDIKEKLKKILSDEEQEVASYYAKIVSLNSKIGIEPTGTAEEMEYYLVDGWSEIIGTVPNLYSYEQMVATRDKESEEEVSGSRFVDIENKSTSPGEECVSKLMGQYNENVRKWIGCKREIGMLNTMLSNFEDSKAYDLTVREATILGF